MTRGSRSAASRCADDAARGRARRRRLHRPQLLAEVEALSRAGARADDRRRRRARRAPRSSSACSSIPSSTRSLAVARARRARRHPAPRRRRRRARAARSRRSLYRPVWKAIAVAPRATSSASISWPVDALLLDAPTAGRGGAGASFDHALARAARAAIPASSRSCSPAGSRPTTSPPRSRRSSRGPSTSRAASKPRPASRIARSSRRSSPRCAKERPRDHRPRSSRCPCSAASVRTAASTSPRR